MIQTKTLAMTEVARTLRTSRGGGKMKRLFSFVSKISSLFSRVGDIGWFIILIILFITMFLMIFTGVIKR